MKNKKFKSAKEVMRYYFPKHTKKQEKEQEEKRKKNPWYTSKEVQL